jgi:hypothetical protein
MIGRRQMLRGGAWLAASLGGGGLLAAAPAAAGPTAEWTFDNLRRIGGHDVAVAGRPALTTSPWGPAVLFDGQGDALFIDHHPLAGAETFTFEAIFRPDGGAFAQRWFHLETVDAPAMAPGSGNTRMLFEIRVLPGGWYLDAFATGPGYRQALMAPGRLYPLGQWHHVAQSFDGTRYRSFVNGELQLDMPLAFTAQGPGRSSVGMRLNRSDPFRGAVRLARFSRQARGAF